KLTKRAEALHPIIEECLNYPSLCVAIKEIENTSSNDAVGLYAPYFGLAKRIIRNSSPTLWPDAERLEAEIRFAAGLFIPLFLLSVNGLLLIRHLPFGPILFCVPLVGCIVIVYTFQFRRIREVIHIYIMAIITLHYKNTAPKIAGSNDKEMD